MPIAMGTAIAISGRPMGPCVRSFIELPAASRLGLAPRAPVAPDRLRHARRGLGEPVGLSPSQIGEYVPALSTSTQVHVGRLPSHHPQQAALVVTPRQARQLDAAAVGGEAPDEPLAVHAQEGIGYAH